MGKTTAMSKGGNNHQQQQWPINPNSSDLMHGNSMGPGGMGHHLGNHPGNMGHHPGMAQHPHPQSPPYGAGPGGGVMPGSSPRPQFFPGSGANTPHSHPHQDTPNPYPPQQGLPYSQGNLMAQGNMMGAGPMTASLYPQRQAPYPTKAKPTNQDLQGMNQMPGSSPRPQFFPGSFPNGYNPYPPQQHLAPMMQQGGGGVPCSQGNMMAQGNKMGAGPMKASKAMYPQRQHPYCNPKPTNQHLQGMNQPHSQYPHFGGQQFPGGQPGGYPAQQPLPSPSGYGPTQAGPHTSQPSLNSHGIRQPSPPTSQPSLSGYGPRQPSPSSHGPRQPSGYSNGSPSYMNHNPNHAFPQQPGQRPGFPPQQPRGPQGPNPMPFPHQQQQQHQQPGNGTTSFSNSMYPPLSPINGGQMSSVTAATQPPHAANPSPRSQDITPKPPQQQQLNNSAAASGSSQQPPQQPPVSGTGTGGGDLVPRLTFPTKNDAFMLPFRLQHNLTLNDFEFNLKEGIYKNIMQRCDLDIQLKCYHHHDQQRNMKWPASMSAILINNKPLTIKRGARNDKPLYVKNVCQAGRNTIQISVTACCCSSVFVLEPVHRPSIGSVMEGLLRKRILPEQECRTKMKRYFSSVVNSTPTNVNGDDNRLSKLHVSLKCAITSHRMKIPGRGEFCRHTKCFEVVEYLNKNCDDGGPWNCPICNMPVPIDELEIDELIKNIARRLEHTHFQEVTFDQSGQWEPVPPTTTQQGQDVFSVLGLAVSNFPDTGPASMHSTVSSPASAEANYGIPPSIAPPSTAPPSTAPPSTAPQVTAPQDSATPSTPHCPAPLTATLQCPGGQQQPATSQPSPLTPATPTPANNGLPPMDEFRIPLNFSSTFLPCSDSIPELPYIENFDAVVGADGQNDNFLDL